jgi:hypothetical protein
LSCLSQHLSLTFCQKKEINFAEGYPNGKKILDTQQDNSTSNDKTISHSQIFPIWRTFAITEEMASGRCDSGNDLENDHFLLHLEAN